MIIGADSDAGALWQPLGPTQGQSVSLGLVPAVRQQGQWQVVDQTPRRQPTLADLSTLYQYFIARTERKTCATFEVKA